MSKFVAFLRLMRVVNCMIIGFAVLVGICISDPPFIGKTLLPSLLGFLVGFFASSFAMITNDIFDIDVDRANKLNRPLVTGQVSVREAWLLASLALSVAIIASIAISWINFAIVGSFAILSFLYNCVLKRVLLVGNFIVATSITIPYFFGGLIVGTELHGSLLHFSAITLCAAFGREAIKTIPDIEGDRIRGVRSVAMVFGTRTAAKIGAFALIMAVLLTPLPYLDGSIRSPVYTFLILVPNSFVLYSVFLILKDPLNARASKSFILLAMFAGLLVFLTSRILS